MPKVEPEPEPEPEPAPAEEEPATEEEPAAAERAEQQQGIDVAKEAAAELQKELSSLSHMLSPEEAAALQEELSDLQRATEQVEATDGSAMIKSVAADFLGMLVTNGIDSALAEGTTK
jgi:molecular chaperone GrpE (heat shock protein)